MGGEQGYIRILKESGKNKTVSCGVGMGQLIRINNQLTVKSIHSISLNIGTQISISI
jgi:hypothetical protein